jgi:nicotinamidase-related amidase
MKTTLILIDIQNDYFPNGLMELEGSLEAAAQARHLLTIFRTHHWSTIHIQHISTRPDATFFLPDTDGVCLHESIKPIPEELVLEKHFPNAFRETALLETLKKWDTERLVICGMMTHMCVDATVRAAADLGFPVLLAGNACASRALSYGETKVPALHVQGAFLAALRSYAQVLTASETIVRLSEAEA